MTEWRFVHAGSAVPDAGLAMLKRAAAVLSRLVPVTVRPPASGGLCHEAGSARDRAAAVATTLAEGAVVVLASGGAGNGRLSGDAPMAEILPWLPADLSGTIIGAIDHGHVLTALVARHPRLRLLLGPPVMEVIGGLENGAVAEAAARDLVALWSHGPRRARLSPAAVWPGPRFEGPAGEAIHEPRRDLRPMLLRRGRANGPVIAGNLVALGRLAGGPDWPRATGAILFCEAAELHPFSLDRAVKRLSITGVLRDLGAIVFGVRLGEQATPLDPPIAEMLREATADAGCPVVLDAFIGSGAPSPLLELGVHATLDISAAGTDIAWHS